MRTGSGVRVIQSRVALIALVAVLVMSASGLGLYLLLSGSPPTTASATPTVIPSAAPSIGAVGSETVTDAGSADALRVVSTSPPSGGMSAPPRTPIKLNFNLPVDAEAAASYFSVLPAVDGRFSQGDTDREIVFTPSGSFGRGSSVNVVLRKGYASRDGYALESDYVFTFRTGLSRAQVAFIVDDQFAKLHNVQSGQSVTVTLQFGDGVPANSTLETFHANSSDLLMAFVHRANGAYLNRPIATANMELVATDKAVNGRSYTITQPDGIYLLLASSPGAQYGALWIDVSRFGVILRQDDRNVVLAGIDLTTGSTKPTFDVTFFNLEKAVEPVLTGSFSATGRFAAQYPAPFDLAVATTGGEEVVIPIGIEQSNADIKVIGDLATQPQIFLTTDRAGYQAGDMVKFGGVVRTSNDQVYALPPSGMTVAVWSGSRPEKSVHELAAVAADGSFHGSFVMPDSAFNDDGSDATMTLFAGTPDQQATDSSLYSMEIGALGDHQPAGYLMVTLDQPAYVAKAKITATISGVDRAGSPLSGRRIRLAVYSAGRLSQPSEVDSFASVTTWGLPVRSGVSLTLDANGRATYTFAANLAEKSADQDVTVVAMLGKGVTAARDAATAIVHQATRAVFMLPARTIYQRGETVIAPFVVETTSGERAGTTTIAYEFTQTDYSGSKATTTVVASGTVSTDSHGMGLIRTKYSGPRGIVELRVKGRDAEGSEFVDSRSLEITSASGAVGGMAADTLLGLSVVSDRVAYAVGETTDLTVISPTALKVYMSLERGRIHRSRWIALARGENTVGFPISPQLAPGFTLTFSYFRDGSYVSEGMPINVRSADQTLVVTLTPDKSTYRVGDTAHLTITVADATGAPVGAAALLIDGYDAAMSANKVVDQASLAGAFFSPALRGTNGSSSLVGIGNWGGRCGISGGGNEPAVTNPGTTVMWRPHVVTESTGTVSIEVPIENGSVRMAVFASTPTTSLGQGQIELNVE